MRYGTCLRHPSPISVGMLESKINLTKVRCRLKSVRYRRLGTGRWKGFATGYRRLRLLPGKSIAGKADLRHQSQSSMFLNTRRYQLKNSQRGKLNQASQHLSESSSHTPWQSCPIAYGRVLATAASAARKGFVELGLVAHSQSPR